MGLYPVVCNTVVFQVLWPYLLEFVLPTQYTEAIGAVCRSLAVIAHRKKTNDDQAFMINYKESGEWITSDQIRFLGSELKVFLVYILSFTFTVTII